jgi:hypothetical protein
MDSEAIDRWIVDVFLDTHRRAPRHITLDLDAADDPLHGTMATPGSRAMGGRRHGNRPEERW